MLWLHCILYLHDLLPSLISSSLVAHRNSTGTSEWPFPQTTNHRGPSWFVHCLVTGDQKINHIVPIWRSSRFRARFRINQTFWLGVPWSNSISMMVHKSWIILNYMNSGFLNLSDQYGKSPWLQFQTPVGTYPKHNASLRLQLRFASSSLSDASRSK